MANLLQKQFYSVFSNPDSQLRKNPDFPQADVTLEDIDFTIDDIQEAIDNMQLGAAPGDDEVPVVLLKNCEVAISLPLYLLWKHSFDTGEINSCFMSQMIAPVFKGVNLNPKNYRPISLTSQLIKIFERVIQARFCTTWKAINFCHAINMGSGKAAVVFLSY